MQAEHLCQWMIAATRDDAPDATNLLKVVAIVQEAYRDGTLEEECTHSRPNSMKGRRTSRGIGDC